MADPRTLPPEVLAALKAGNRIEAIKILRQRMGVGLAEARSRMEALEARSPASGDKGADAAAPVRTPARTAAPRLKPAGYVRREGLSPGEVPRTSGGTQAVIIVIAIVIAIWVYARFA